MRKLLLLFILLIGFQMTAQDAKFTTTHTITMGQQAKMEVEWEVYKDSLIIMEYKDKKTIKMMERMNQPIRVPMQYPVQQKSNDLATWYEYQDDMVRFLIQPQNNSVRMTTRDSYTGASADMTYLNL